MQLTKIRLHRFRGFRDFIVSVDSFTNLVGKNSRGKTTVLQAIQFAFDAVDKARLVPHSPQQSVKVETKQAIYSLSLSDVNAIWHNRDTTEPFEIELYFDNGYKLRVSNPSMSPATLTLFRDSIPIQAKHGPEWKELGEVADVGASYIPPIGATSGLEGWKNYPNYQQAQSNGLHSQIWRNSLYWQYNDGDKSAFEDAVALVKRYISVEEIRPPRQGHEHAPSVAIEYVESKIRKSTT